MWSQSRDCLCSPRTSHVCLEPAPTSTPHITLASPRSLSPTPEPVPRGHNALWNLDVKETMNLFIFSIVCVFQHCECLPCDTSVKTKDQITYCNFLLFISIEQGDSPAILNYIAPTLTPSILLAFSIETITCYRSSQKLWAYEWEVLGGLYANACPI